MGILKMVAEHFSLFLGVALFALVVSTLSAQPVLAQPPDAGEEPTDAPIIYNLTPREGANVAQDELSRAAATIETRHNVGLAWAGIFVDGRRRPSALMGPTAYLQTVSADIGNLSPGAHVVRIKAVDSEGRAGGYVWRFTVV
jgi:hypothetical protein